ncbi:unnamed protein product (macronuclear) [Paramecium tetraurelia]|uniref:Uncharacterized protein n=1 Tax=Paramecium tetraurelia TaxID=5888 RepID=A0DME8_PARTE|nr:uncharacterized protein GSPATT00018433001 [Paramecium tetraurelia]CAK84215.1 unnamed protein product [Paramecium tetraurelia]|eukprot:XP_001451612.1 hypothetical protein (macronuclear) [Paramecium tetraurelia strain d4-2]
MSEDSNSILTTIKYYKSILKFPSFPKQYSELDETQEQNELFFCNSKQRKEESLKLLKEWAQNRMDLFEKNREIVEELAVSCDYRIRLSVDFLQIVYKFFNEKYFHEQQYAQFLITKPQPALKQNPLNQQLYSTVGTSISTFEENNLKRLEKIANFAHTIQTEILKAQSFHDLSDMDKQLDLLLSSIISQKKLLQNYITSAGQKLNQIIQQFPQHGQPQRQRKPIFDDQQQQSQQSQQQPQLPQQSRTDKILQNISALGTLLVGASSFQDPVEMELNQQMKEQERQIREQQLKEEQSLSNGSELQQDVENQEQKEISNKEEEQVDKQSQSEKPQELESQSELKENQNEQQFEQKQLPQKLSGSLSSAEYYKQQQQLKERQQFESNNIKSKNYQPQGQSFQQNKYEDNGKKINNQPVDVYRLIISFVATQQYANKSLNQLAEKVLQYWKQVITIEQKRAQWAKDSCLIYKKGIAEVHNLQVDLPELVIDVEQHYNLKKILPKEIAQFEDGHQEEFIQTLVIKEIGCQAARLLLVKEFRVHVVDKNNEQSAILVLTIDKYVGCWLKHDDTIEAVDNPVLHYPIKDMAIQKVNELILDIMPSRHLLFLNIANDRQKSRIKFQMPDDMEEFCTISQAKA